ncbi:MAG: ribosome-associated translation inhibitor RaiA [Candidatus Liptonbacteria bacterium]|nr:ribosome-associated translation inhibitor RaiA [Candidatus Liptonbacteria bacterium]
MKITIKSTNLDLIPSLRTYIENKLSILARLVKKFETEGEADLRIEVARTTQHHHKGEVFMAEVNFHLSGRTLRATETSNDIRRAIDIVKHKLHLEIEKFKEKRLPIRGKIKK